MSIDLESVNYKMLNDYARKYHYMHRAVHHRSCPFGYLVNYDGQTIMPDGVPAGFIMFASIHFTRKAGLFGYADLPTKWQVLSLARLWLHPDLQRGGRCYPGSLPGYVDRKGVFRSTLATDVIKLALRPGNDGMSRVGRDWLQVHPPRYPDEPYHIRIIISYADKTHGHTGAIYRAAGFDQLPDTISQRRHNGTRSNGFDNHTLATYVMRLPEPEVTPIGFQLGMRFMDGRYE